MMGGILRKPGILAEMGIIALNTIRHEVLEDNEAARKLGKKLESLKWVELTEKVETNMVFFKVTDQIVNPADLKAFLLGRGIKAFISPSL